MNTLATALDQSILDWMELHIEEYISVLSEFVSIPSVARPGADGYPFGKPCHDMLDYIQNKMKQYGLQTDNVDDHVVIGTYEGTKAEQTIGIACHGDVVPAEGTWDNPPFSLVRNGNWLTGRGSTDNKGATIAMLFLLRYFKEKGIQFSNTIKLYVGSAEEIGMYDMKHLVKHRQLPDFTMVPDAGFPVCHGEKGNMTVIASTTIQDSNLLTFFGGDSGASVVDIAKATLYPFDKALLPALQQMPGISHTLLQDGTLEVISTGKARHTAFPDEGVDAIGQLARALVQSKLITQAAIQAIGGFTEDFHGAGLGIPFQDEVSGQLTGVLTIAKLEKGTLTLQFNVRYPVTTSSQAVQQGMTTTLQNHGFSIQSIKDSEPCFTPLTPKLLQLCDIANHVHSTQDTPYVMGGGTYARIMRPAIAYGMGTPSIKNDPPFPIGQGRAHQPNESVYLPRMIKGMRIYAQALLALDTQ